MTTCRYDKTTADYLTPDGEPCRTDEYGDPTRHCTARRTCSMHVGHGELTCARCVGRTRTDLRQIVNLHAMMLPEAIQRGSVECEAASLAGPAADPVVTSWRRIDRARTTGGTIGDGTDEADPTDLLGTWQLMLSEDYGHDLPDRITLATAAAYLERNLHHVAQDERQDFGLLRDELRRCRSHLEAVLRNSRTPERGAPCPECTDEETGVGPRLVREYGHWCDDPECTRQFHHALIPDPETGEMVPDTTGDHWVCPRDRDHSWPHEDYTRWIEERQAYVRRTRGTGERIGA